MIDVAWTGSVAVVRIAHGKVNALDLELLAEIRATMAGLAEAPAVVLTGTGTVFSAGVDLRIEAGAEDDTAVAELWQSAAAHARITAYLDQLALRDR